VPPVNGTEGSWPVGKRKRADAAQKAAKLPKSSNLAKKWEKFRDFKRQIGMKGFILPETR
jgi:hypothetical protein